MKKQTTVSVRNPLATGAWSRSGAGAHGRSKKAQRRSDKVSLKKEAW